MWTRVEIKERAKDVLRKGYWKAFLVSLIILIVGGSSNGSSSSNWRSEGQIDIDPQLLLGIIIGVGLFAVFAILFRIFIGSVIEVGGRKFFIQADSSEPNINHVMSGFKNGYGNTVLTMFYRAILLIGWFLLLIIPGIIKSYAYTFVPYILADNPDIKPSRAIEMSNQMTNGHKFDMFVLDLSFIGWYLLGGLALGIGVLFVNPYRDATMAQLYLKLRQGAIDGNITSYNELNLIPVEAGSVESDEWKSVFDRDEY